ncbi:MAG: PDZ domain-containing protein, partial [Phycisphaerales bacterium]|nr:PDZ domain-containing protein [Phycisphaerales bacterium]
VREGRLFVTEVRRGTPALDAGLNVDDEILAINGFRVAPSALDDRLARYRPGTKLEVLMSRREKLETLSITATAKPRESWKLEVDPAAPEMTKARRAAWLRSH